MFYAAHLLADWTQSRFLVAPDSLDVHLAVDAVHGRDEGDGDESDDHADEEDDGRLEQAGELLELVVELPVEVDGRRCRAARPGFRCSRRRGTCAGPRAGTGRSAPAGRPVPRRGSWRRGLLSPCRYTALVVASPVTWRASGSGTPAPTIEHRIRQKRSRMAVRMRSPSTGTRRSITSRTSRPRRWTFPRIAATTTRATRPANDEPVVGEEVGDGDQACGSGAAAWRGAS